MRMRRHGVDRPAFHALHGVEPLLAIDHRSALIHRPLGPIADRAGKVTVWRQAYGAGLAAASGEDFTVRADQQDHVARIIHEVAQSLSDEVGIDGNVHQSVELTRFNVRITSPGQAPADRKEQTWIDPADMDLAYMDRRSIHFL